MLIVKSDMFGFLIWHPCYARRISKILNMADGQEPAGDNDTGRPVSAYAKVNSRLSRQAGELRLIPKNFTQSRRERRGDEVKRIKLSYCTRDGGGGTHTSGEPEAQENCRAKRRMKKHASSKSGAEAAPGFGPVKPLYHPHRHQDVTLSPEDFHESAWQWCLRARRSFPGQPARECP